MTQAYIIIDMQNDFIDGALGSAQSQAVVPRIEAKIVASKKDSDQETDLIFTQDTRGWRICKQLLPYTMWATILEKPSFGCPALVDEVRDYDRLVLMGLCTDICVIANAMLLKAFYPEKEIIVDSTCCAGSTPENHERALQAMKACQIDIV